MVTVVFLVALRLTIGWHFLYEGVWKIKNADTFSATPFLAQAKGPAAPLFHAMLPDPDGRQRLATRKVASAGPLLDRWRAVRSDVEKQYQLEDLALKGSYVALWDHQEELEAYLRKQNREIVSYFDQGAPRKSSDRSGSQQAVPENVRAWLSAIRDIETRYHKALGTLAGQGDPLDPKLLRPAVPGKDESLVLNQIVGSGTIRNPRGDVIISVEAVIPGWEYTWPWKGLKNYVLRKCEPSLDQEHEIKRLFHRYKDSAEQYLAANQEFIEAHFQSVDRYDAARSGGNVGAPYQKKRTWDRRQELTSEVDQWLSELDGMGREYHRAVSAALDEDQRSRRTIAEPVPETNRLPIYLFGLRSWSGLVDFAVTYGLTAIGICLMAGLCTRLACIGGGVFLIFVMLTQPAWPAIYPPTPAVVGHALIIDKNFVEMIALFALATTAVGRWGGLDFFLHHWLGKPLLARFRQEGS
jgi:uncharacterized membrane protein YphA (DoxX/SURF4 family)